MTIANEEYIRAVNRASQSIFILSYRTGLSSWSAPLEDLHSQIKDVLHMMLVDTDEDPSETNPG